MLKKICLFTILILIAMPFAVISGPPEGEIKGSGDEEKWSQFHDEYPDEPHRDDATDEQKWSHFDDEIQWAFSDSELADDDSDSGDPKPAESTGALNLSRDEIEMIIATN